MTSTLTRFCAGLAVFLASTSASLGQGVGPAVASDLDGDGAHEQFRLADFQNDGIADLLIDRPGRAQIVAGDVAWIGGIGQQPELSLAPNGSVRLTSMNDAVGRSRWRLTLTIAYRRGAYRVAGYTYEWYDTIEIADNGTCDLNLLNGKGTLQIDGGPLRPIRTGMKARAITDWSDDIPIPRACGRPQ